jgi:hypothetical protein
MQRVFSSSGLTETSHDMMVIEGGGILLHCIIFPNQTTLSTE